jgi:hypothetical protein
MAGRPLEFKDEYCEMLIDHMGQGYSFESFAGVVGCCKQTLYNWLANEQFLDAKNIAFECSRFFWEKIGIEIAKSGQGNATAYIFNMKNRFKDEWKDKQETEHSGNAGFTVTLKRANDFPYETK